MKQNSAERTVIVLNRKAGSSWRNKFQKFLNSKYLKGKVISSESFTEMVRALDTVLGPSTQRVIIIGGDGTCHHVINEIMIRNLNHQVDIGLLPMGTGSDLARSLNIPTNPVRALRLLEMGKPEPLDVIRINLGNQIRYAVNIASIGLSSAVAERVNQKKRKYIWTYLSHAFQVIIRYKIPSFTVHSNDKEWYSGPVLMLVAANGRYFGRGIHIAPGAIPNDGLIYGVIITTGKLYKLITMLPGLYSGSHLSSRHVLVTQMENLKLDNSTSKLFSVELDGESYIGNNFEATVESPGIRIIR